MERIGSLVVFKAGVSRKQAEAALRALDGLIEPRLTYPHTERIAQGPPGQRRMVDVPDYGRPVKTDKPVIETFDDDMGGPVWYIP